MSGIGMVRGLITDCAYALIKASAVTAGKAGPIRTDPSPPTSDTGDHPKMSHPQSEGATGAPATNPPAAPAAPANPAGDTDTGFPADTPLAEMTVEQQLAYHKHHHRKAENALKAYKGVTAKDISDMQAKISKFEAEGLTANELALKQAVDKAVADATAAVEARYVPQLREAAIRSHAAAAKRADGAALLDAKQIDGWMGGIDTAKFLDGDGQVDKNKVLDTLTALFGPGPAPAAGGPGRQWGQYGNQSTAASGQPGSAGRAEAQRRFGKT